MSDDGAAVEPALAGYTGHLLMRAFVRAQACGTAAMPEGRHPRELAVLIVLTELGPVSQAELCELLRINRTIMVRVVDDLERAGLVRRLRDPADRRRYALAPTVAGTRALPGLLAAAIVGDAAITAVLTAVERRRLNRLLVPLLSTLDGKVPTLVTDRTGYRIAHAHYHLRDRAHDMLRPIGIGPREFALLATMAAIEPCSQQGLAMRLGVSAPAIVKTLEAMVVDGLIARQRHPQDRREHVLRLSATGHALLARARSLLDDIQHEVEQRLTRTGAAALNSLLIKLISPGPSRA